MMKLYLKSAFDEAKKDKDGFVFLNVKFDGNIILPMRGKLSYPFNEDAADYDNYDEIENEFASTWILKDIPECAKHLKSNCNGNFKALYWDPYDEAWCFANNLHHSVYGHTICGASNINGVSQRAVSKVKDLTHKLHMFEIVLADYYAFVKDEDRNNAVQAKVNDYSDLNDIVELRLAAICDIEKAKRSHKKIPYAEVGNAAREFVDCLSDAELGKLLANGFTSH